MGKAENQPLNFSSRTELSSSDLQTVLNLQNQFPQAGKPLKRFGDIYTQIVNLDLIDISDYWLNENCLDQIFEKEELSRFRVFDLTTDDTKYNFFNNCSAIHLSGFSIENIQSLINSLANFDDTDQFAQALDNFQSFNPSWVLPTEQIIKTVLEKHQHINSLHFDKKYLRKQIDEINLEAYPAGCDFEQIFPNSPYLEELGQALNIVHETQSNSFLGVLSGGSEIESWVGFRMLETILEKDPQFDLFSRPASTLSFKYVGEKAEETLNQEVYLLNQIGLKYFQETAETQNPLKKSPAEFCKDYLQERARLNYPIPKDISDVWKGDFGACFQ